MNSKALLPAVLLTLVACGGDTPSSKVLDASTADAADTALDAGVASLHPCDLPAACSDSACGDGLACIRDRCVLEGSVVVTSDEELSAAIADASTHSILVAPGNYGLPNMAHGQDRTANPLTQGLDPGNRPVFVDATQSLVGTRHVSFKNLSFVATGNLGGTWFADGGGNGAGGDTSDIAITCSDFHGMPPGDLNAPEPDPNYPDGMTRLFGFSNYATHNYTLRDITADFVYQVGDFRMNGDVVIDKLVVDYWYFDGIRIIASGEEGYVEGDRLISHVDLTNNLAVYNELGNSAPHPDNTQVFTTGSTANNTNPTVQNLLFYRNRFNPGQFRSNNTQSGLSQSRMVNVGYVENLWATKASPHGISLEGGADGVLIERNTMGDVNWESSPWVRIFRTDAEVLVAENYFPGGFNYSSNGINANGDNFDLIDSENEVSASYPEMFAGPSQQTGTSGLVAMFTPLEEGSPGALTAAGEWNAKPHRPMRARAPELEAGAGSVTLTTVFSPTLQSPDQSSYEGHACQRFDARWALAGQDWEIETDVGNGASISTGGAGSFEVQTRCVNAAGEGLWSRSAAISVN